MDNCLAEWWPGPGAMCGSDSQIQFHRIRGFGTMFSLGRKPI